MKYAKTILITFIAATLVVFSGCGENSANGSSNSQNTAKSGAAQSTVLAFYNKVDLGQTKDKIDAALAVTPTTDTDVQNQYEYDEPKTDNGVAVLYDKDNKATGKTVKYGSHADIAPFCKKPVTKGQSDKITKGMTYDQVKELLGGEGVEVGRYDLELNGKVSLIRRWANSNGSCIQAYFATDGTVNNALFYANDY